jgi:1-acyl-sn-glycerol-3-phosphate acyltransferase
MTIRRAHALVVTAILWGYFIGFFLAGYWVVFLVAGLVAGRRGLAFGLASYSRGFFALLRLLVPRLPWTVPERRALRDTRGAVIICNHVSFLDPLLLLSLLPHVITIVRPDFLRLPIFGWLLRGAGFLDPDQFAAGQPWIDKVALHLRAGGNLLIFPEGTRSRDGKLAPFRKGAFYLARVLAAPLLVLRVRGTNRLFAPGRLLFDPTTREPIEITRLTTIPAATADAQTSHELALQVRAYYEPA